jgi:hypothetical protein
MRVLLVTIGALLLPIPAPAAALAQGPAKATAVLECTEWTNQALLGPSSAGGDQFIDCILEKSPLSVRANLRHRLATGGGGKFIHHLNTGEDPPAILNSDCPYLQMALQPPDRTSEHYQLPFRDLLKEELAQVGFVIAQENEFSYWSVHSLASEADRESAVWSISMEAQLEPGDDIIPFTRNFTSLGKKRVEIRWLVGLMRAFPLDHTAAMAKQFAEGAAHALLPGANWRCHDRDTALKEEKEELEQIRVQLNEKIIRDRAQRAEQEKHLKLEVEQ